MKEKIDAIKAALNDIEKPDDVFVGEMQNSDNIDAVVFLITAGKKRTAIAFNGFEIRLTELGAIKDLVKGRYEYAVNACRGAA